MNKIFKMLRAHSRFWVGALVGVMALAAAANPVIRNPQAAQAQTSQPLNCSAAYQIVQTLSNGAKWEMCWEARAGYGYRLNQVTFTPANGTRRLILNTTHVAQLFVPYDDNGPRYHDISYGVNLATLTTAECPGGTLLTNSTMCLVRRPTGYAFNDIAGATQLQGESFAVFGYYSVGNYYYIFQYTFADDGAIQPAVGASGSLQRFAGTTSTGWPVKNQIGVNHNHRVIWRMDFDLNGSNNNLAEQIDFGGSNTNTRTMTITPLTTETKSQNNLDGLRFWRVRNTTATNADGHSISYEIEPSLSDQYRASEAFTQNDFYATQYSASEILVDDGNGLDSFVSGQAINDLIVWYGVNFHHVPRDEDDVRMPAHFQGFTMRPRDLEAGVSGGSNLPTPTPTPTQLPLPTNTPIPPTSTPGSGATLIDPLNDFSQVFEFSDSAAFALETALPELTGNDASRLLRGRTGQEWATWRLNGMSQFVATTYFWDGEAVSDFTFLASSDNVNFTPVIPVTSNQGGNWSKIVYTINVPNGTNYVRVVFPNNTLNWTPQLGEVRASSGSVPAPTNTPAAPTPTPTPIPPTATPASTNTPVPPTMTPTAQPNQLPNVSITAPSGSFVGSSFTFSASASDPDGSVARVEFYMDGTLVGSDTTAPYSLTASVSRGSHTLTAKAIDTLGGSRTSSAVSVYRWL